MPTYSYSCTSCKNAFDVTQSFDEDTLTTCESCGGRLRKMFTTIGVTFNGSGFYRTDSRASSQGKPSKAPSSSNTDSGTSSMPKKETAPTTPA